MQRVRHADSGVKGVAVLMGLVAVACACLRVAVTTIAVRTTTMLDYITAADASSCSDIASRQERTCEH